MLLLLPVTRRPPCRHRDCRGNRVQQRANLQRLANAAIHANLHVHPQVFRGGVLCECNDGQPLLQRARCSVGQCAFALAQDSGDFHPTHRGEVSCQQHGVELAIPCHLQGFGPIGHDLHGKSLRCQGSHGGHGSLGVAVTNANLASPTVPHQAATRQLVERCKDVISQLLLLQCPLSAVCECCLAHGQGRVIERNLMSLLSSIGRHVRPCRAAAIGCLWLPRHNQGIMHPQKLRLVLFVQDKVAHEPHDADARHALQVPPNLISCSLKQAVDAVILGSHHSV